MLRRLKRLLKPKKVLMYVIGTACLQYLLFVTFVVKTGSQPFHVDGVTETMMKMDSPALQDVNSTTQPFFEKVWFKNIFWRNEVRNDPLANIAKPYYNVLNDEHFEVDRTYFSLRERRVSSVPETYFILGEEICGQGEPPTVVFIVPSVASENATEERLEIRQTWAARFYNADLLSQNSSARLAFFFGGQGLDPGQLELLANESATFGDIVVGDFVDSYRNLSLKMAAAVSWVAWNCPSVDNMIKVDMDTYVMVDVLLSLLAQLPTNTTPAYIFGYRHGDESPLVMRTGRWAVSEDLYPFSHFPRYIYGHNYVISWPAVTLMAESFPYFPIVPNEDAFMTGLIALTLNITQLYHETFAFLLKKRTFCEAKRNVYASVVVKRENRLKLWSALKDGTCSKDDLQK